MLHSQRLFLAASFFILTALSTTTHAEETIWPSPQAGEKPGYQQANEEDWNISVGAGAMYGPAYEGSDKYVVTPLPDISIEYRNGLFFANIWDGIGSYPIQGENYKVGAAIGFDMGRKESDDRRNLRGMGDIDLEATFNFMGEYDINHFKLSGKVSTGTKDYGTTAKAELGTMFPATEHLRLMGSIGATWADDEHMKNYFGVSPRQSARSGHDRYSAGAGIKSVGFTVGAFYSITENWDVKFMLMGDQLLGDAANSPITKRNFNPSVLLTIGYNF
ncbi:MipA/OmpV family protein [Desulfovibrio desulfuricans]|uniref:MipA/OmpV family protein n=1 Tax=Desulfovibrio desulfuricans TaxID=876 RepID=UPI00177FDC0A|nr:MipA/OmpV family protein [Desulfovibrio desulfuricans]MBD8897319.1 MipA/OmpV family protein [Desulfovibrio desulfuricans]